jgi:PI3-kinase family, ras-binding domain
MREAAASATAAIAKQYLLKVNGLHDYLYSDKVVLADYEHLTECTYQRVKPRLLLLHQRDIPL